jgi:hypothetical protein
MSLGTDRQINTRRTYLVAAALTLLATLVFASSAGAIAPVQITLKEPAKDQTVAFTRRIVARRGGLRIAAQRDPLAGRKDLNLRSLSPRRGPGKEPRMAEVPVRPRAATLGAPNFTLPGRNRSRASLMRQSTP